ECAGDRHARRTRGCEHETLSGWLYPSLSVGEAHVLENSDMDSQTRTPPNERYSEVPPPPQLADLVASLWQTRIAALGDARVRIMPNACVDIVVYASDTS